MKADALHIAAAVVAGGLLGSLADWLFAGVLFHSRYQRHPDTWRAGRNERGRIVAAQALSLVTSAGLVMLSLRLGQTDLRGVAKLAAMIWLIGPLPLLVANHLFIRIDPLVTASHAAGWLAKLLLTAGTIGLLIG